MLAVLMLGACSSTDRFETNDTGFESPITSADITYAQLAQRYNQTVEPLGTLWARTDVVIEWREPSPDGEPQDAGDVRREIGEGKLFLRQPDETALLVEKLGQIYLWAGSNSDRYWLFDLVDSGNKKLYVGDFAKLGNPGGRAFPLPVRPDSVPHLMGLVPLPIIEPSPDQDGSPTAPEVRRFDGQYLVDIPSQHTRMLIDPETFRPTRIDLTNDAGYSLLTAKLQGSFGVNVPGVRKTRWPTIAERAEVYVAGYASRLTIAIDNATTDPRKIRDTMFDLDALAKSYKPGETVTLDAQ